MSGLRWRVGIVLITVVAGLNGCAKPVKLVPASGVVLIDGKPAEGILVQFLPQTRDGRRMPTSFGTTAADGSFALTTHDGHAGAVEGPHAVLLADTLEERPAQGQRATRPPRLDARHTTLAGGLTATVADGGEPIRIAVSANGP